MWKTSKWESIIYLALGVYIANPTKFNIFFRLMNLYTEGASQRTLEIFLFLKIFLAIIGAIIAIAAAMDIFDKVKNNEFA